MDQPEAVVTLRELARQTQTTVDGLEIQCRFCEKKLNVHDKFFFELNHLSAVLREGTHFGTCIQCSHILAKIEFITCLDTSFLPWESVGYFGVNLWNLTLRCLKCMKPLNAIEKGLMYNYNEPIYVVRGRARGRCIPCRFF